MNIQGFSGLNQAYGLYGAQRPKSGPVVTEPKNETEPSGTQVTISAQAKALAAQDSDIAARLESIKAKPAVQRSTEEFDFVRANDKKLAEIVAKDPDSQTAEEIDYMQKASGFVNTMAQLSPQEKKLYDELVANGDTEARRGLELIAMSRTVSGDVALSNGVTFDPSTTEINASNVRRMFSQLYADEDGKNAKSFDALAKYLDNQQTASQA